jgi:hypothetical protein
MKGVLVEDPFIEEEHHAKRPLYSALVPDEIFKGPLRSFRCYPPGGRVTSTWIESKRAAVEKLDGFGDNLVTVPINMHQSRAVLSPKRAASYNV